ncbi:ATP-dependent RNA helicase DHX29-like [Centruroides sculpturatus]|uniref:ATP-dependent RNA helicase DHX29-like n=1 Tax=Centruroides sculpturatus TaxID=218467 RepID=UPI000C6E7F1A|nr:ATP-dependent RNA helicase DHX29-like [Centruroides sculpturatus]
MEETTSKTLTCDLNHLKKLNFYLNEKNRKRIENLQQLISTSSSEDIKNVLNRQYELLMKKQRKYFISSTNMRYKETPSDLKKFAMNNLAFGDECWISTYKNEIIDSLNKHQIIIIKGESGYGKSTRIPLYVQEINEFCQGKKIASCQPNYINILSLSSYMSTYYKNKLNLKIGYVFGKENTVNNETNIVFTNCQSLLQECIRTPYLSKYFCIIIDEYFLQSAEADLLLLHMKEILQQRSDFKLILINPAFDITDCKSYFKDNQDVITMISLPSLTFPVKTVYNTISSDKTKCVEKCAQLIKFINNNKLDGNILIFLPSTKEMESCCEMVKNVLKDRVEYHTLHNMMNQEEIFNLYTFSNIRRKVIFANQCAESLWLPNISYVIDSGKLKESKYQSEKESYISKFNSERRKNLAGWSLKNCCYRIYTSDTLEEMLEMPIPDILKIEPSQLLLTLYRYKIPNPIDATFISLPGNEHIKAGLNKLIKSKVIKSNSLTTLGEDMINYMPMQTSHAKLIALGRERGIEFEAVMIHTISSLKNPIFMTIGESKDIGKLKFFHRYGDYFAVFDVYFNWIKQVNKERWCEENGINHTAVTYLHGKIDDTCKVFGIKPKEILSNLDVVYELICECFIDNFCTYSVLCDVIFNGISKLGMLACSLLSIALIQYGCSHENMTFFTKK